MNDYELQQQIQVLCNDELFRARLSKCTTPAQIADLFTGEGFDISAEEMEQLLATGTVPADGELDEDALDAVAGGGVLAIGRVAFILRPLLPSLPVPILPPILPIKKVVK